MQPALHRVCVDRWQWCVCGIFQSKLSIVGYQGSYLTLSHLRNWLCDHLELGIAYYYLSLIVPQRKGVILIHQASHDTTRAMISPILLAVACYPAEKTRTKIIYVGIVPSIIFWCEFFIHLDRSLKEYILFKYIRYEVVLRNMQKKSIFRWVIRYSSQRPSAANKKSTYFA